jgi:hypothetical protein
MVKFKERPVEENIADLNYASGASVSIALPRERWLQKVMLRFSVVVATAATTPHEDGIINLIRNVKLRSNKEVYYDCRGWDVSEFNRKMYKVTPVNDSPVGTATYYAEISLDLMQFPSNLNDQSALVNTKDLSGLDLSIQWGTPADLGAAGAPAITSGSVSIQLREADLTPQDIERIGTFYTVKHSIKEKTYTATTSEFVESINLPIGKILHYIGVKTIRTSTAARSNDVVSKYMVKSHDTDEIVKCEWNESIAEDRRDYQQASVAVGYTAIDLQGNFGGYDSRGEKDGDIKLHHNIPTNVGTVRLFVKEVF